MAFSRPFFLNLCAENRIIVIRMKLRTYIILIIGALALLPGCGGKEPANGELLESLDTVLSQKALYDGYFRDGLDVLKEVLREQTGEEQRFSLSLRIADAYRPNCVDSSLYYLKQCRSIASRANDPVGKARAELRMAVVYVKAGYLVECGDILSRYRTGPVPPEVLADYYRAEHIYWGETMAYSSTQDSYGDKLSLRDSYRLKLLSMVPEESWEWYNLKREEADESGNREKFREYAEAMVTLSEENTREYAEAAYYYAHTFPSGNAEYGEWIIRSAIADAMCATKDYAALNEVARLVFSDGDVDRAFRYAADHCMVDALQFNGKLRPWQILTFFPEIENAYQSKHEAQSRTTRALLWGISVLFVALLLLLGFLVRRQKILDSMRAKLQESYLEIDRRNRELVGVNERMQESDKVKQEYITLFLGMVSDNISATRQYKNRVLKYIRQGKTKALTDEIENQEPMDSDIAQFYKMFDQTFLNLYPDFIEKFNALLVPEAAIVPKGDDLLTPELRIFALIKLGITESSRIASLLHYSANTIYNYRAKIKNRARGSREDFEAEVRRID